MRPFKIWLLGFVVTLGLATSATAHSTTYVWLDPISTLAQQAIHVALPEFESHGFHIEDFDTAVCQVDSSIVALFTRKGMPGSQRGSSDAYPSLEVKLDANATYVVESHFLR